MGIFNTFKYSNGLPKGNPVVPQTLYGNSAKIANSAGQITAVASVTNTSLEVINGVSVKVTRPIVTINWSAITGDNITGIRLLRNQDGFSEFADDGVVVYEWYLNGQTASVSTATDGAAPSLPIVTGRYCYYTIWTLNSKTNSWTPIGYDAIIIPKKHDAVTPDGVTLSTSEDKFVNLLPRIFTTIYGSSTDELSDLVGSEVRHSVLYDFLSGFSYTLDEIQTSAELLLKTFSLLDINPNFIPVLSNDYGLPSLSNTTLKTQKNLLRQVPYIYKNKGTMLGIKTYCEALTSYPTTVTVSPNLLLSIQDSSFYKTTGNWVAGSGVTLTSDSTIGGPSGESYSVNNTYVGKVVTTGSSRTLSLGNDSPLFKAVPVTAGNAYYFTYYSKKVNSTASTITPAITWYDYKGASISTSTLSAYTVTTSWVKSSVNATAPSGAAYAAITLTFSVANTYHLDMLQLASSSVSNFHEARAAEIYLGPTKVNFIKDPSFSNVSPGWTHVNDSAVTYSTSTVPGVVDGSNMVNLTASASPAFSLTSNATDVVPLGQYYTFSIYCQGQSSAVASIPLKLSLSVVDSSNTIINFGTSDNPVYVASSQEFTATPSWNRFYVSLYVPSNIGTAQLQAKVELGTGATGTYGLRFDSAQVEAAYSPTDFFDGDYIYRGAAWVSTANQSTSYAYPSKDVRLVNLENTIAKFLPMNTPYVITSGYGSSVVVEATGVC
jgi:hypothetical protein